MMNVLLVLLAKVMFSGIIEGANSEFFSLASLACSKPLTFCISLIFLSHLGKNLLFPASEVLSFLVVLHGILLASFAGISQVTFPPTTW